MICFKCKGDMIESFTTYVVDMDRVCVIVRRVPCFKCGQCGEVFYRGDVTKKLAEIVKALENAYTEIAIVSYPDVA